MKLTLSRVGFAIAAAGALFIYGCGGSSGSSATATSSSLTGIAATGAALSGGIVAITNKAGTSPCTEASIITTELGSYTCTLKSGETAPFFIVVTDPTGNTPALVSIATETPAAGTPLTINATPLTTAIVAQLNNGDALGVVSDKTKYIAADFTAIKANVVAQLKDVLTALGVPAGYDPFTTKMTAATATQAGDTADKVLDIVKISTDSTGKPALTIVGNDTPITIATKDPATVVVAAKPAENISELSLAAQLMAQAANSCWALPVAQRVTLTNGQVTGTADACKFFVTDGSNANGLFPFKNNGYNAGQWFYNWLTSNKMTGAKFSVPEIMAFYPAETGGTGGPADLTGYDKAIINIRFLDSEGNPGNDILVAARLAGTSTATRPTNWWIVGNQQPYDTSIKAQIRKQEQFGPNTLNQGPPSRFQSGLAINIPSGGPNLAFDTVLVTGPGLPDSGLWYFREGSASTFSLSDRRLTTAVPANQHTDSCVYCNTFWMSKTVGITGADAAAYKPNPFNWNWAQGTGKPKAGNSLPAENSYNGTSGTRPVKGSLYTFSFFNNGSPVGSFGKRLLGDLVDPAKAVNLQWNSKGPQTTAMLDPSNATYNGSSTSLPVDWIQNPAAEQIRGLTISMTNGDDDNTTPVPKGVTSVVAQAPSGKQFTALSGSFSALFTDPAGTSANGYREIFLPYRTLDGNQKSATFLYYP